MERLFKRVGVASIVASALLLVAHECSAQEVRSVRIDTLTVLDPIAEFHDAVAVEVDPLGNLYVLDRRKNTMSSFDADMQSTGVFGGPGRGGGQFDSPNDFDATTGFLFLVADTGNERIQRLGTDFVFLETLSVDSDQRDAQGRLSQKELDVGVSGFSDYSPIAVTSSPDGKVFSIDSTRKNIVIWNSSRQITGVEVGDFDWDPVDMVYDESQLLVLDQASNTVVVLDIFGNHLSQFGADYLRSPRSLKIFNAAIWVVDSNRLLRFTRDGSLSSVSIVQTDGELLDLALVRGRLFVLTATGLYTVHS